MTRDEIRQLAEDWVAAWNAHDLEAIISHYDERVELISPVAEQLLGTPNGKVSGITSGLPVCPLSARNRRGLLGLVITL